MMTAEKQALWEKHQRGTLTEAEADRWQSLLREDPAFYDEIVLLQTLEDAARHKAYARTQSAARAVLLAARSRPQQRGLAVFAQQSWVMAASVAVLLLTGVGIWLWQRAKNDRPETARLLKTTRYDVFPDNGDS